MRQLPGKLGVLAGVALLASTMAAQTHPAARVKNAPQPTLALHIEGHGHFDEHDAKGSVQSVLQSFGPQHLAKVFLLMPPDTFDDPGHYDADVILPAAQEYRDKIGILGGGGTLNAMIQQAVKTGDAGPEVQKRFREQAESLLRQGVVGFGEMTAEHFKSGNGTPYQYAPADHPLFLMLADIAAQHNVPIVLHMEAVPQDMPLPAKLKSPPNAPQLHANIAAFERLLAHNPRAHIIWAHLGNDNTGFRTPELAERLMRAHPNLYQEIKIDPGAIGLNSPLSDGASGKIKSDWLKLFQDFPDRFLIGSDQHYPPIAGQNRWEAPVLLLNQLPPAVRRKIAVDNARKLYSGSTAKPQAVAQKR